MRKIHFIDFINKRFEYNFMLVLQVHYLVCSTQAYPERKEHFPFTRAWYEEYKIKKNAARKKMAIMIEDPVSFHDDRELQKIKAGIDMLSVIRKQLEVFVPF
ncbi:MAG: hypothetical protein JW969_05150 [Spirochaetales bacterium]|nr:hypothetical protein [Spirochaetales bacterium]